ncbi:MAG: glycolate oxidase subunit GlcE [Porticoccaceae bacterium]|nr:glycolate oxidase subunit GlcE [Porticoccaceae bacterium]
MPEIYRPTEPEQLIDLIHWAQSSKTVLAIKGSGSKGAIGHPVPNEHVLDLTGFAGISQYDPVELVLTAGAGTSLQEVETLLAEHNQMLAFEPPDYSTLFDISSFDISNQEGKNGTLGGILAGNISGPRRFFAGAARDHFLGFKAVSGRGEPFKSGGRVVKNVTGFDLSKLMAGSWGTLAALWEVTVKVLPVPEKTRTLLIFGFDPKQANQLMTKAATSPHSISAAAYLPQTLTSRSAVSYLSSSGSSVTAIRLEGPAPSVKYRLEALKTLFGIDAPPLEELHGKNSSTFWCEIGNLSLLKPNPQDQIGNPLNHIWRLSLPPATGWQVLSELSKLGISDWFLDQAGGAAWLACPKTINAGQIRDSLIAQGGHATLWSEGQSLASANTRDNAIEVFQAQPEPLAALTRLVKASFDPAGILNPGRMYQEL